MDGLLKDRVAIITGAAGGIGRAVAKALHADSVKRDGSAARLVLEMCICGVKLRMVNASGDRIAWVILVPCYGCRFE